MAGLTHGLGIWDLGGGGPGGWVFGVYIGLKVSANNNGAPEVRVSYVCPLTTCGSSECLPCTPCPTLIKQDSKIDTSRLQHMRHSWAQLHASNPQTHPCTSRSLVSSKTYPRFPVAEFPAILFSSSCQNFNILQKPSLLNRQWTQERLQKKPSVDSHAPHPLLGYFPVV